MPEESRSQTPADTDVDAQPKWRPGNYLRASAATQNFATQLAELATLLHSWQLKYRLS